MDWLVDACRLQLAPAVSGLIWKLVPVRARMRNLKVALQLARLPCPSLPRWVELLINCLSLTIASNQSTIRGRDKWSNYLVKISKLRKF